MASCHDHPLIVVIGTGGTIAGRHVSGQSGRYVSAVDGVEALTSSLANPTDVRLQLEDIAAVSSADITPQIWQELAGRIEAISRSGRAAGIVITHGTDTLEETAFFLDCVLDVSLPVVLTGAMRPATAPDADGPGNLRDAIMIAADPLARERGVLVVMNGRVHAARHVQKIDAAAIDAFASVGGSLLGTIEGGQSRFNGMNRLRQRRAFTVATAGPPPRVDIIHAHAGQHADVVRATLTAGARGIVLAGVGPGHASMAVLEELRIAVSGGIPVVRASRIANGLVARNSEIDDEASGFVASGSRSPQKARILLQLLLAANLTDRGAMQAAFLADD